MYRLIPTILAAVFVLCAPAFTFKASAQVRTHGTRGSVASPAILKTNDGAQFPFEPVEKLSYEGFFTRLLVRGINVAELSFTSERVSPASNVNGAGAQSKNANFRFTMDISSKGIVPRLFGFRFHEHVESTIDAASFSVLRTTKFDEQNERQRASEAVFDKQAGKVVWTERNPKEPQQAPRIVTTNLISNSDGALQDVVSIFYFLRTRQLTTGLKFDVHLSDAGQTFSVPIAVLETKKLKTALGEVSTVRVDVDVFGDKKLLPGDGTLSIWFTNDARRIPVQAHVASSIGTIDVKLKSRSIAPKTVN
ncbi:MAG: DUF3108 domain-containing protein [Pyrinomonadaceae bacterium]